MNGELLSGGLTPGLLSMSQMYHPWERADLTATT